MKKLLVLSMAFFSLLTHASEYAAYHYQLGTDKTSFLNSEDSLSQFNKFVEQSFSDNPELKNLQLIFEDSKHRFLTLYNVTRNDGTNPLLGNAPISAGLSAFDSEAPCTQATVEARFHNCYEQMTGVRINVPRGMIFESLGQAMKSDLWNIIYHSRVSRDFMKTSDLVTTRDRLQEHVRISRGLQVNFRLVSTVHQVGIDFTEPDYWAAVDQEPRIEDVKLYRAAELLDREELVYFDSNFACDNFDGGPVLVEESKTKGISCTYFGMGTDSVGDLYKLLNERGYSYSEESQSWSSNK